LELFAAVAFPDRRHAIFEISFSNFSVEELRNSRITLKKAQKWKSPSFTGSVV